MTDWIYDPDNLILHNLATGVSIGIKLLLYRLNNHGSWTCDHRETLYDLTRSFDLIKHIHDSLEGDYTEGPDKKYIRGNTIPPRDVIRFAFGVNRSDHAHDKNLLVETNDEKIAIGLLDALAKSTGAFEMKGCLEP